MRFEEVVVSGAEGAVLAHGHRFGPGLVLKKGHTLSAADCRALAAAGKRSVTVALLDADDLGEDDAAHRVAAALAGPHLRIAPPATGRANLFATVRGLLVVTRLELDAMNLVDEAITIATRPPHALVEIDEMIATVKIIPFAVQAGLVARVCDRARAAPPLLAIAPLAHKRAGLVLTTLPGVREEQLTRAAKNQRLRMTRLGGEVARELRVEHDTASVARAVESLLAERLDLVLVLGASAVVDRRDVIPSAIEAIGGVVDHLGMPVDPGNLLLLGHKGSVPIVGVPGCARSLDPSGFDWVLERLIADVAVRREDIMRLGVGGLLGKTSRRGDARRLAPRRNSGIDRAPDLKR